MRPRSIHLAWLLLTALSCLAAYQVGRRQGPPRDGTPTATSAVASSAPNLAANSSANDSPEFSADFAAVREILQRGYWTLDAAWQLKFDALSSSQLESLASFVLAQPPSDARGELRRAIYASWARRAPLEAVAHAEQIAEQGVRANALSAIMKSWAFADLPALEHWARNLPSGETARAAVTALLAQVGDIPPATLFDHGLKAGVFNGYNPPLEELLDAWARTDPRAAAAAIEANLPAGSLFAARNQLARAWAAVDPVATIAWLESLSADRSQQLFAEAFNVWARNAPAEAANRALQLTDADERARAIAAVAQNWISNDFTRALHWLENLPAGTLGFSHWHQISFQLSSNNPSQTIQLLRRLPASVLAQFDVGLMLQVAASNASPDQLAELAALPVLNTNPNTLLGLVEGLLRNNPMQALAIAKAHDLGSASPDTFNKIIGRIARTDPELALQEVQDLPNSIQRDDALAQITADLAKNDPDLAAVFAEALPIGPSRDRAFSALAEAVLNRSGGEAAVTWIGQIPDPTTRAQAMDLIAQSWIQNNFAAAMAWYRTTGDLAAKQEALNGFAKHWPKLDPRGFVEAVRSTTDPATLNTMMAFGAGGSVVGYAPDLARPLIEALPPGDLRDSTLSSMSIQLSHRAPAEAMALAASLPDGPMRENTMSDVLSRWALQNPTRALEWLQQQPAGSASPGHYAKLARGWMSRDPTGASNWLWSLPASPARDAAIGQIGELSWFSHGFEDIAPLMTTISDPAERLNTLHQFTRNWLTKAPAAAAAWIATLDLPPDQKAALLAGQKPGP